MQKAWFLITKLEDNTTMVLNMLGSLLKIYSLFQQGWAKMATFSHPQFKAMVKTLFSLLNKTLQPTQLPNSFFIMNQSNWTINN